MKATMAALAGFALAGCGAVPGPSERKAFNEGYIAGSADAVKQLYWAKQAVEAAARGRPAGRVEYFSWEESGITRDGRRLAPETVGVPVFIPARAPARDSNP